MQAEPPIDILDGGRAVRRTGGQAVVFSTNSKFKDMANEVYPKLQEGIGELIIMIKEELNSQRIIIKK